MPRVPSRYKSFVQREKEWSELIEDFKVALSKCYFWQIYKKKEIKEKLSYLCNGLEEIREGAESERIVLKSW